MLTTTMWYDYNQAELHNLVLQNHEVIQVTAVLFTLYANTSVQIIQ